MPSLGFGFERIGYIPLRAPRLAAVVAVAITLVCALGLTKLSTDHSISSLFRSQSEEFAAYERLKAAFPASERDVLLLISGKSLLSPDKLGVLQDLQVELQLTEGVDDVISIFSVPKKIDSDGIRFLIPSDIDNAEQAKQVLKEAREHPLVKDRLLTMGRNGLQTLLTVVNLSEESNTDSRLAQALTNLRTVAEKALAGSGIEVEMLGAPVMTAAITKAGAHDRLVFNLAGFAIVAFICVLFFRRWTLVTIVVACPVVAIVWSLGVIGLLGFHMSPFMNTIAPLVLVVTFTNAMHMVFSIHHSLTDGLTLEKSIASMVGHVGAACVMTTLTTALALLSLVIVDSEIIRTFGFATALAAMVALAAVTFMVPLLSMLLLRRWPPPPLRKGGIVDRMQRRCDRVFGAIARGPRIITVTCIVLLVITGAFYFQLAPQFRLSEQVPDRLRPVISRSIERNNLPLTTPIAVVVDAGASERLFSDETLSAVAQVHHALANIENVQSVWSPELLRQFAEEQAESSQSAAPNVKEIVEKLPRQLAERFVNRDQGKWLLVAYFPDLETTQMVSLIRKIEHMLDPIRAAHKGMSVEVTGLAALASIQSSMLINQLQLSLITAVVVVLLVAAFAFRSPSFALFSMLPNILPLFIAGTVIYAWGGGLEYASVMALTVAFGLAVDDTIHFMNRYRMEREGGLTVPAAIERSLKCVGPVLAATSVILIAGLGVTLLSEMESTRVFGELCIITLVVALAGDLILLPATMLVGQKLLKGRLKL